MAVITRVGYGYDLHRLGMGSVLTIAAVPVPAQNAFVAHSDGDVALHAMIDAMLGAAGLDDIGVQFPDDDPAYKGISSSILVAKTLEKITEKGYRPVNVDITIIAQRPRLTDHKAKMRESISQMLSLEYGAVSVKAKTNEGLGDIGQGHAIACQAIVGLTEINL